MDSLRTPFQRRLAEVGDRIASEQLGVKERTVKAWRLGDRRPRPAQAQEITSRWPITLDDIYIEGLPPERRIVPDRRQAG